jgi:hypothetical protein
MPALTSRISIWRFRLRLASRLRRDRFRVPADAVASAQPILAICRSARTSPGSRRPLPDPARRGGGGRAAAYYIPGVDNLLDTIATPAAFVAGTIISAAVIVDMPPLIKWATAIIAGGGIAGLTQGTTALLRAKSTVMTGTLGNPVLATAEVGGSLLLSILALLAPIAALLLVVGLFWLAIRLLRKLTRTSLSMAR